MEVALGRPQDVLVVLIERVDRARPDLERLAGRHVDDLALAGDAVVGLEVVLVVEVALGALEDPGLVHGVTHAVVLDDHPLAVPAGTRHVAGGVGDVLRTDDDHGRTAPVSEAGSR